MKFENIKVANKIANRITSNTDSVNIITLWLKEFSGDSDGHDKACQKKLYNFYMGQYKDQSGYSLGLSGSMVQTQVLEFTKISLETQITKDLIYLETL